MSRRAYRHFTTLKSHWDLEKLKSEGELKAFFFDKNWELIKDMNLSQGEKHIEPSKVLDEAANVNAEIIIIAQSDPEDEISLDAGDKKTFDIFRKAFRNRRVKIEDILKFSPTGYYSSLENKVV